MCEVFVFFDFHPTGDFLPQAKAFGYRSLLKESLNLGLSQMLKNPRGKVNPDVA